MKKFYLFIIPILSILGLSSCSLRQDFMLPISFSQISGNSMESTLSDGDYIISIKDNNIKRGDIVITKLTPLKEMCNTFDEYIIKRVIGVPGDTVKYTKEGLYINGTYIKEEYTIGIPFSDSEYDQDFFIIKEDDSSLTGRIIEYHSVIPEGYYFLMGDNRNNSLDSREYGLFSQEEIIQVVVCKLSGFSIESVERGILEWFNGILVIWRKLFVK